MFLLVGGLSHKPDERGPVWTLIIGVRQAGGIREDSRLPFGSTATTSASTDGIGGYEALVDGVVEHYGEHGTDGVDGRGCVALAQVGAVVLLGAGLLG
jgi:hypothetical protein